MREPIAASRRKIELMRDAKRPRRSSLTFHPVTPDRWKDLERLFGERGACGGCWCMWWRLGSRAFEAAKGDQNRRSMRRIVKSGRVPGILAYEGETPIGWCSVAPRDEFPRLSTSRILAPVDGKPVWSVVCFFVAKGHRGRGVSTRLLEEAVRHVRRHGGRIVEGYPVEPRTGKMPDAFAYTGLAEAFRRAGFREIARRSDTRPIMRRMIGAPRRARRWRAAPRPRASSSRSPTRS